MSTTTPQQHFITLRRIKGSTQAQLDFTISSLEATLQHIRYLIPKLSKELAALVSLQISSADLLALVCYQRGKHFVSA